MIYRGRNNQNRKEKRVRLIFTQNQSNPPIHQWVREAQKYLTRNEKAKELGSKIQIAYKQPKSIKRIVTGASREGGGTQKRRKGLGVQSVGSATPAK